jgi:beta-lactamase class A
VQLRRPLSARRVGRSCATLCALVLVLGAALARPQGASANLGNDAFQRAWNRTDKPVARGKVTRTWMWGPALTAPMQEASADAPGGTRLVQYFDKSRMEITHPDAVDDGVWYVTNGLLAKELVTGQLQTGSSGYEPRQPAAVNVAGDSGDPDGVTYASFAQHLDDAPGVNGWLITARIDRAGVVSDDPALGQFNVTAGEHVQAPGIDHQIASVFWDFMTSSGLIYADGNYSNATLFQNPFYATGYPLTEPYWASVTVSGTQQPVLVQVFERRVLTYNPANAPEWRVEAGNVGRHYYEWRYGGGPASAGPDALDFMDDLQDQLGGLVSGWDGWNAVAVTDLQTGRTVGVNADRPQLSACTIKVFIMMAVAQDLEAGRYPESEVYDLILGAMGPSNTWPARELIRYAGGGSLAAGIERINGIMQGLGMRQSVLAHPPDYPGEFYGFGYDNLLTADEMNMALGKLYRGEALTPWATQYVLWSMTLAIPGQQYSLGGGIPDGVSLYHKIGLIYAPDNTWNDAGVFTFQRNGQTYAYAVSYLGSYGADWHDAYYHGASVSELAWNAFNAAYR